MISRLATLPISWPSDYMTVSALRPQPDPAFFFFLKRSMRINCVSIKQCVSLIFDASWPKMEKRFLEKLVNYDYLRALDI